MDRSNFTNVKQIGSTEGEVNKVALMLKNNKVPDPYYGNDNEFKKMFNLIDNASERISKNN